MKTEIRYGTRVKEERLKRGWTQEHLAEVADVTARTVARIEKGEVQGLESLMAVSGPSHLAHAVSLQLRANIRQPSRGGHPSPALSAATTNRAAPAQSPVPASFYPRHFPCQPRLISSVAVHVSGHSLWPVFS